MNTFTTKLTKRLILPAVLILGAVLVQAQEEEEEGPLTLSGSVDTYYRANLNTANDGEKGSTLAPTSSFANGNGFSIGMINLIAGYEGEKVGFVGDLVFGPRGDEAVFGSAIDLDGDGEGDIPSNPAMVNQLYVYWNVSDAVTLTLGNFNTFLGYEVISPSANFNYSTSYMFSYGPFSHTGLKADFSFGDFSLVTAVMNTTDMTETSADGQYYGGVQLGYGGAYLNFLFDDDYFQADLTAGWDLSDSFYLGVNATTASDNFYGGALYLQSALSDDFSLGLRGEYFSDEGVGALPGEGTVVAESVVDLTLSANYSVGNLTFIPEFRVDVYDEDVVIPETGEDAQSSLASFLVAAVYSF